MLSSYVCLLTVMHSCFKETCVVKHWVQVLVVWFPLGTWQEAFQCYDSFLKGKSNIITYKTVKSVHSLI